MKIEILGTGCSKCKKLDRLVRKAVDELGIEAEIVKVEDIQDIMKYNILSTPGLVIDNEVKIAGTLPKMKALKEIIKN